MTTDPDKRGDESPGAADGETAPSPTERAAEPAAKPEAPPVGPPEAAVLLLVPELPPQASVPAPVRDSIPLNLPTPKVAEISPAEGPVVGETRVTLRGDHLYRESIVRFGGLIAMTVGAVEPRELSVRTPPRDAPGAVDVSVQNFGAPLVVLAGAFRYEALRAPKITGVAPRRGAVKGGTELSVSGEHFVAGSVVLVDGVALPTRLVDASTLEARTPPGKAGAMVDIAVENPGGKRAVEPRAFAYDERYG